MILQKMSYKVISIVYNLGGEIAVHCATIHLPKEHIPRGTGNHCGNRARARRSPGRRFSRWLPFCAITKGVKRCALAWTLARRRLNASRWTRRGTLYIRIISGIARASANGCKPCWNPPWKRRGSAGRASRYLARQAWAWRSAWASPLCRKYTPRALRSPTCCPVPTWRLNWAARMRRSCFCTAKTGATGWKCA